MTAMGGVNILQSITSVDYTAVGYREMVEQSVRPAGPYFIDYETVHVTRDYLHHKSGVHESHSAYAASEWWLQQTAARDVDFRINDDVAALSAQGKCIYGGRGYVSLDRARRHRSRSRDVLISRTAGEILENSEASSARMLFAADMD